MEIIIKDSFRNNLPKLSDEEYQQLEADILENGCRDTIVLWKGKNILVDGHHRHDICTMHNISFQTVERDFGSEQEALFWAFKNQVSRRNLNDYQRC